MEIAIQLLQEKLAETTKGLPTGKVIGIASDQDVFVNFRGYTLYANRLTEIKVGDTVLINGTCSSPTYSGILEITPLPSSGDNTVLIDSIMSEEDVKIVEDLQLSIKRLTGEEAFNLVTPSGKLIVRELSDINYPGFAIDVQHPDGFEEAAVVVEYHKEDKQLYMYMWQQGEEDFVERRKWKKS